LGDECARAYCYTDKIPDTMPRVGIGKKNIPL
jgi:hypothetical protein